MKGGGLWGIVDFPLAPFYHVANPSRLIFSYLERINTFPFFLTCPPPPSYLRFPHNNLYPFSTSIPLFHFSTSLQPFLLNHFLHLSLHLHVHPSLFLFPYHHSAHSIPSLLLLFPLHLVRYPLIPPLPIYIKFSFPTQ